MCNPHGLSLHQSVFGAREKRSVPLRLAIYFAGTRPIYQVLLPLLAGSLRTPRFRRARTSAANRQRLSTNFNTIRLVSYTFAARPIFPLPDELLRDGRAHLRVEVDDAERELGGAAVRVTHCARKLRRFSALNSFPPPWRAGAHDRLIRHIGSRETSCRAGSAQAADPPPVFDPCCCSRRDSRPSACRGATVTEGQNVTVEYHYMEGQAGC